MVTWKENKWTMNNQQKAPEDLVVRIRRFALDVIKYVDGLPNRPVCWVLGKQLLRSGTSVGANHREGKRARSTAEFSAKLGIAQFEAEETAYWLELLMESGIANSALAQSLWKEANELQAILGASIRTANRRKQ